MPLSDLLRRLTLGAGVLLLSLWLFEISGLFEHHGLARLVTLVFGLCLFAFLLATALDLWASPRGPKRNRTLALAVLLVAAFVIQFVGLDFELLDRPIGDEGVFQEVSQLINRGEPIPKTFNYGHFLYYAGAFAIWFHDLFPAAVTWLLELFYTTIEGYGVQRILLLSVNALLSALVAGAVFGAAYRVAGASPFAPEPATRRLEPLPAAAFAGCLVVFSPLFNGVAHELIADVPAAAFAAFTLYFVSRLLEREELIDYLLAGVAAGLAAASKYPAGVVAVAIFAVWLYWRIHLRAWSWKLLGAALASLGAMVAVMPGLVVYPEIAFRGSGFDIFFGFRQYAYGGWIGVQPDSNLLWYGREILVNFGWPAITLGLVGVVLLKPDQRRRWLLMSAFPVVYLTLILSMSMVVRRNLQAALPALAILVGVGVAAVITRVGVRKIHWVVLGLVALALPAWRTTAWSISQTRPGTRQLARAWMEENIPEGASLVRERYTPQPDEQRYAYASHRFAAWLDPEDMKSGEWDYLILAQPSYARFVNAQSFRRDHQEEYKRRYLEILEFPKVAEFAPSALTFGPLLSIHQLLPDKPRYLSERLFLPDEATFISHKDLRRDGPGKPLQYTKRWQFAVFKDFLSAGDYQVELGMNPLPKEGYLHVVDRKNREVGRFDLRTDIKVTLPADEKYLLRVFIAPPTRLYGVKVSRAGTGE